MEHSVSAASATTSLNARPVRIVNLILADPRLWTAR
jgi:hypothetical protein